MRKPRWIANRESRQNDKDLAFYRRVAIRDCADGDFSEFRRLAGRDDDYRRHELMVEIQEVLGVSPADAQRLFEEWKTKAAAE